MGRPNNVPRGVLRRRRCTNTVYWTVQQATIWSSRPYGCNSYEKAEQYAKEHARDATLFARRRAIDELGLKHGTRVYAHLHPLAVGLPNKVYSVHDYVTTITDSMTQLCVRQSSNTCDFFGFLASAQPGAAEAVSSPPSSSVWTSPVPEQPIVAPTLGWRCPNTACNNRSRDKLQSCREGATCMLCGVVVSRNTVATHRERLGASEDDDNTMHADAPYAAKTDAYDRPPMSANEYKAAKRSTIQLTKLPGKRLKGTGRMCDAARTVVDMVVRESAVHEALNDTQIIKLRRILEDLEVHFESFRPMPLPIQREIRYAATAIWTSACKHADCCEHGSECQIRLTSYAHKVLAVGIFQSVVQRIRDNVGAYNQIDSPMIANVYERMQRSSVFAAHQAHVQMNTLMTTIRIYEDLDFKVPSCGVDKARVAIKFDARADIDRFM